MIDRVARNTIFDQLRKIAAGRISGFECENNLMSLPNDDRAVDGFRRTLRELIDENDASLKPIFAKKSEMRSRLARWLVFLKSDCAYRWPDEKLPPGILDFYKSSFFDRLTGADQRMQQRIARFMQAGEYNYWPFKTKKEFVQTKAVMKRKGLRIGDRQVTESSGPSACDSSPRRPCG